LNEVLSDELALSTDWANWLIENYVDGVKVDELVSTLEAAGVPTDMAGRAVQELAESAFARSLRRKVIARDQLHALVSLKGQLARLSSPVVRRAQVSAEDFFENYYFANRPVILTDVADKWVALERWSRPEYFAEKFGDAPLSVCMGRDKDPYCDRNFEKYLTTMTMRQYAAWVASAGETNDGYLISNNRLLENPAFDALLEDIVPPEAYVEKERFRTYMSFWFGPKGTFTPLHHDGNNILFCQVAGRKEFYLVSPWETELLHRAEGYYAHARVPLGMDNEGVRPPDDVFKWPAERIVLGPGEALFLPVGWWHQVRSLDVSVSISFLNFRAENHFHWYAPGKMGAP
jgi:Cupin-like domain